MARKVKELDPYIKARVGEALLKLEGLIKPSNLPGTSRLYYTGQWAKDIYDNYTLKQAAVIFKKVEKLKSNLTFYQSNMNHLMWLLFKNYDSSLQRLRSTKI